MGTFARVGPRAVPMKKLLPASLAVLILAMAGAAVYLVQKPGAGEHAGKVVAGYLPAETLLLLSLPDPGRTAADWKTTDLYKIWTEPQVQAFLSKPLSKMPVDKDFRETWAQAAKVEPTNLFVALTALDAKNEPQLVAGFQFKGSTAEVDKLLAKPKEQMRQKFPGGKADLVNYQGHAVETFDTGDAKTVASVYDGDWYLVSNDMALLKATVDRVDGRTTGDASSLEKQADFAAVMAKMPANFATFVFGRPQVFLGKAYEMATASGQNVDAAQHAEADKIKAIGASTAIEKGKLRDTLYTLAPGLKRSGGTLTRNGLALSSPDTLLFLTSLFDEAGGAPAAPGAGKPELAEMGGFETLGKLSEWLGQYGITAAQFRAAFGREGTLQLDWAANNPQPGIIASLDVRDPAEAGKFVDALTKALAGAGEWQTLSANGVTLHTTTPRFGFISPTFALADKHFVFGLTAGSVQTAAERLKGGGANFTASEPYKTAVSAVHEGNVTFGYLDTRGLFERLYGALKPMALLGTTFMYPQANDYVELGKLPDAETISKHLTPTVLSQSADDQGVLLESVGPVTFIQAGMGLGGVGGAAAFPMVKKQFGLFGTPADEASATPGESPSSSP